jgi:hypothetical protein
VLDGLVVLLESGVLVGLDVLVGLIVLVGLGVVGQEQSFPLRLLTTRQGMSTTKKPNKKPTVNHTY